MSIAITVDQEEFAASVRRWAAERDLLTISRRLLNREPDLEASLLELWQEMAALGWTGLLVAEDLGGSGGSATDGAVLIEALARSCAPLPTATTLAVSSVLGSADTDEATSRLLAGVADGSVRFGTTLRPFLSTAPVDRLSGQVGPVHGGLICSHLALLVDDDVVLVARDADGIAVSDRYLLDATSGTVEVTLDNLDLGGCVRLPGAAAALRNSLQAFIAADASGVAGAALDLAVSYSKVREAFGRSIGTFQAVKHHCANMLLASTTASAATWRAAEAVGSPDEAALSECAAFLATNAALSCSKTTLQVLGGIGFTWEHDLHLYLRRAGAARAVIGPLGDILRRAGVAELEQRRPRAALSLPPEAEEKRAAIRSVRDEILAAPVKERHALVVEGGYLYPHWPAPWGRDADAAEQLVIEEEFAEIDRKRALGPTYWEVPIVIPTILDCGSEEQVQRWVKPTMLGETRWCQLFSEPGAGSDLAALKTRATKVEGGWLVNGQKVWTSDAHHAHVGLALVRTDPDGPKHKGITCLVVDLTTPGVTIRPLKQITGEEDFNEVFLDDVFVADDDVVGPVNNGWKVARATLEHERVSLGSVSGGWVSGVAWASVMAVTSKASEARPELLSALGEIALIAEGANALTLRGAMRAVLGQPKGIDGTIGKTVVADHAQRVGDFCLDVLAEDAAFADGDSAIANFLFLKTRMATIAGGTSEVMRNVLAEQALGLPREPALAIRSDAT